MPAFAASATFSAWGAYLFFAIVATVVIVLLLHEALEEGSENDDTRTTDALGLPRYVAARTHHEASADGSSRSRA